MNRIFLVILLVSCSSVRHYKKVAADDAVTPKKKAIIAPFVSTHFSPQERVVTDTIVRVDSLYDVDMVAELSSLVDSLIINQDTIGSARTTYLLYKLDSVSRLCGRVRNVTTRIVDTVYMTDAAKEFSMRKYVDRVEAENAKLISDNKYCEERISKANMYKNVFLGLFIAAIVLSAVLTYSIFKM